jgi:hypothetical protein
MLTQDQIDHFETFGFLVCQQIFTSGEIDQIIQAVETVFATAHTSDASHSVFWEDNFIERNQHLIKLIEDDRVYLAMQDLIGDDFLYMGSEGMRGLDRGGPVHHWHADSDWSLEKLNYKRIKAMIYLDPLKKETGALRVIPGSHRLTFHEALRPFQEAHTSPDPTFFGLDGADVPAYVVETVPGDMVFFNQWLFHAVYGQSGRRRNIVLKFADRPTTDASLAMFKKSPQVFKPHAALRSSQSPRIQHLIADLPALSEKIAQMVSSQ